MGSVLRELLLDFSIKEKKGKKGKKTSPNKTGNN